MLKNLIAAEDHRARRKLGDMVRLRPGQDISDVTRRRPLAFQSAADLVFVNPRGHHIRVQPGVLQQSQPDLRGGCKDQAWWTRGIHGTELWKSDRDRLGQDGGKMVVG